MTRIRRILHPTDFSSASRPAFERAVDALARADEEGVDDVVEVEARLANDRAERRRTPKPAQALTAAMAMPSPRVPIPHA